MCFGSAPQAPDPVQTALAQNAVNKDALTTAAQLNQVNQTSPFGSISYSGAIGSPDRTQTTTLSPELQKLLDSQLGASNSLGGIANERLAGADRSTFQLPNDPTNYGDASWNTPLQMGDKSWNTPLQQNVQGGDIQLGFDSGGQTQRALDFSGAPSLNTDFSGLAKQAQDANYARQAQYLDPQFAQSDQALASRLAAQGITQGSDAYNTEMDNAARQKQAAYSDARLGAIGAGDAQANALFGQNLAARQQGVGEATAQGQFGNAALAQQFAQNQAQAQFHNESQAQGFNQGLDNAQLNNQALAQNFAQGMDITRLNNDALSQNFNQGMAVNNYNQNLYNQKLSNQILGRNQNINEAMAYLNGTPISPSSPTFQPIPTSTAAQGSPDAVSLAGSNYNAQQQARAALLSSIFGAAGKVGGAAVGCWVAREVFRPGNPDWVKFRTWMFTKAPKRLLALYLKHGERFAEWISDKPRLKSIIRTWMKGRIHANA